jgi:metal-responsive CopG/Arc/MetJ family transcriptional regulator
MWSSVNPAVQKETITKKRVNICVDKNLYERFKVVADKDMRKYSNILEGAMRRYVQNNS